MFFYNTYGNLIKNDILNDFNSSNNLMEGFIKVNDYQYQKNRNSSKNKDTASDRRSDEYKTGDGHNSSSISSPTDITFGWISLRFRISISQ